MKSWLSCILLLLFSTGAAQALTIDWRQRAIIDGSELTLGEIADIEADRNMKAYLENLRLGPAPRPGQEVRIDSLELRQRLLQIDPDLSGSVFTGADVVVVKRGGIRVGTERLRRILDDYLVKQSRNYPGVRLSFQNLQFPPPFVLPRGELRSEVRPSDPDLLKTRSFNLIFRVNGRVERNLTVRGEVVGRARVAVLTRDLPRGTLLGADDVTLAEREINRLHQPFFQMEELPGKKLKRSLRRGDVLTHGVVATPPVVRRGQPVTIVLRSGALSLSAKGIAKRDGKPGETIPVRNIGSQKIILCRVTGPGQVRVEF
ncbi:flagella basal body P-ring formation protein FlgA [Geothermobacter ehrlichii]|uniref:Flagella basal body P-ring formation protein FlgA n=1 Tax=Geothermobacter ehrlichii TaxID=213224 RepID=A0A5D3WLZ3_9BACT|nr:flagellar basal body P-ring formation chaperone FlgA [Geothermobacter ehrlichii]TYP00186.1 flagella basal body P-ring formation protein FlgA [Geothermobacter ehrlichii]